MTYKCGDTQCRYTPDAGTEKGPVSCGVCGTEMPLVAENSTGPRGYVQAMCGSKGDPHDIFSCPHSDEDWHKQVIALRRAARDSVSFYQDKAFREEAEEVLHTRKPTKEFWS